LLRRKDYRIVHLKVRHLVLPLGHYSRSDADLLTSLLAMDALDLPTTLHLLSGKYTKLFSNAALHWILRPESRREAFFSAARSALVPGGVFAFEMGGLGNVQECTAAILGPVARRVGMEKAWAANPWFFPDEDWARETLENKVGGWKVERAERVWRPTVVDTETGVEGWARLMGKPFFEVVKDEQAREMCMKEAAEVLKMVCAVEGPGEGGRQRYMLSYVRLRVLARRVD
jgi:trans-aconitate methyltransferase